MAIRKDIRFVDTLDVDNISSRKDLRRYILTKYAIEDCNVKIRYFVETFDSGKRIYLERPTRLNKGCDFVLFAEDVICYKNGNDTPPSHKDVLNDIEVKKNKLSPSEYDELLKAIKCIYDLKPYAEAKTHIDKLPPINWSYELLLKLVRWLFIEQDITYWAGNGRNMLYTAILSV